MAVIYPTNPALAGPVAASVPVRAFARRNRSGETITQGSAGEALQWRDGSLKFVSGRRRDNSKIRMLGKAGNSERNGLNAAAPIPC